MYNDICTNMCILLADPRGHFLRSNFFNFMKLLGKMSKMVVIGATHPVWEILDQALILFNINMLVLGR